MIEVSACDTEAKIRLPGGKLTYPIKAGKYSFGAGINVLAGAQSSGGEGLSLLLSGRCGFNGCKVSIDGREVTQKELSGMSCLVGFAPEHKNITAVRRLITDGLRKNKDTTLRFDDITEKFTLTPERLDRRLAYTGNEHWRASLAVGYAYGKKIYCTLLLSADMWEKLYSRIMLDKYLRMLGDEGAVVLLVTDDAEYVKHIADNIYYFD